MKKITIISVSILLIFDSTVFAYWAWSPKTNKWVNPKYEAKDSPKEQLAYALEFFNSEEYKKALDELNKLIKRFPKSYESSEAQFYIGSCFEKQKKLYEAFLAYQKVIDKYPFSERTSDIIQRQYNIGEKYLEISTSNFWRAFSGQEHPAVIIFKAVVNNAPYGQFADKAQYKIGLVLKDLGRYTEAKDELNKLINEYPQSQWVQAAKYQIADVDARIAPEPEYSQENTKTAVAGFEEFVKQYPDAELSEKAREEIRRLRDKEAKNNFNIAKFYEKQKSFDSAKIYYKNVFENYPESQWAKMALEKYKALE